MSREMLLIGGASPRMNEAFAALFDTIHRAAEIADLPAYLAEHGAGIEAVATNGGSGCSNAIVDALPNLKIISGFGVGYDAVDAPRCAEKGIIVTHTPNVLNDDVANTAVTLLLATTRRVVRDDSYVRRGDWAAKGAAPLTRSIAGKTIGIMGLGRIGKTLAQKLEAAFGCKIVYHGRSRQDVPYTFYPDLAAMAADCFALINVAPGGAATDKKIDRKVFDALGPEGTFINVGRGTTADEAALIAALQEGTLGAAGLDVFEAEPKVPEAFFAMENVTLLPHVGSATVETRQAMGDLTVENLRRFFEEGTVTTPVPECAHLVK